MTIPILDLRRARQRIAPQLEERWRRILDDSSFVLGPEVKEFEKAFAAYLGVAGCVAVANGTDGLVIALRALGLRPGDEVIVPAFSFFATAEAVVLLGGRPVFADVDPRTLNLDPAAVEAALTDRTKAIVAVDMFGYPCELDELRGIAERHGLALIDDSCEALGARYKGAPVGSHGISAVFGFYPNKQITTGEGGVVTTHSEEEWQLLKSLRNQGRSYESRWFHHVRLGFNYRFTDLQAAVGIAQLEKLHRILALRTAAAARYAQLLREVDGVEPPLADDPEHTRSWFVYVIKLDRGIDRDAVLQRLAAEGIEAGHYVPCVHLQPYLRERYGFVEGLCPVAEDAASRTLALPFFPQLEVEDQERVVDALRSAIS